MVLAEHAHRGDIVYARWEVDNRIGGEVRAIFFARELKNFQFMDDLFASSAGWTPT